MVSVFVVISLIVGATAVLLGIILSPIPTKLGLYRFIASKKPQYIGLSPAFHYGIPWKYTYEELYSNCSQIKGQTALITGANSGVGYQTAKTLAKCGVHVTMACRNLTKCQNAAKKIVEQSKHDGVDINDISTMTVDTSSLKSVQKFSKEFLTQHEDHGSLDMLYLNAGYGGYAHGEPLALSEDGIELVFATNYVGHHLMYRILEPLLLKSKMARVIQTASAASFDTFEHIVATNLEQLNDPNPISRTNRSMNYYGQSKLAQILWVKYLTKRLGNTSNIFANALHPGAVDTGIWDKFEGRFPSIIMEIVNYLRRTVMWTAEEGTLTQLYLGVAIDKLVQENVKGKYFHPQAQEVVNPLSLNENLQSALWEFSESLVSPFL
mmetsp:Transcript_4232/g.5498  ORF Transcript_4232/g.5498 Transcript_4232/m.5498 type:complete len:380 (+) Transcript_4232:123-1262(+)